MTYLDTRDYVVTFENGDVTELIANFIAESMYAPRLPIPVYRNLFFGPKKPFLTGILRISFFLVFSGGIFHRNVFLERSQEFLFFSFFYRNKPIGASLLQQFLIGGWKEVRWAGGGWWVWVGVSGQENQLTLRGGYGFTEKK